MGVKSFLVTFVAFLLVSWADPHIGGGLGHLSLVPNMILHGVGAGITVHLFRIIYRWLK